MHNELQAKFHNIVSNDIVETENDKDSALKRIL